jgi:hypothetical protein
MKHIRLFEGFRFNTEDYYTNIDSATYDELLSDTINMTNKDIEIITKDLKYEWDEDIVGRIPGVKDIRSKVLVIFPESGSMTINKLDDDWFIVRISSIRDVNFQKYKCDQIEGLLKFLKDKDYLK